MKRRDDFFWKRKILLIIVTSCKTNMSIRVLLVEDVELNMEIAEELIGTTGVQIDKAYNGKEAVELFAKNPCGYYHLIFMEMPVMDGYEATKQIRGLDKKDAETIPIIALSANALADDVENALNAGMNEHIAKPIDMEAVWKILKKYLIDRNDV